LLRFDGHCLQCLLRKTITVCDNSTENTAIAIAVVVDVVKALLHLMLVLMIVVANSAVVVIVMIKSIRVGVAVAVAIAVIERCELVVIICIGIHVRLILLIMRMLLLIGLALKWCLAVIIEHLLLTRCQMHLRRLRPEHIAAIRVHIGIHITTTNLPRHLRIVAHSSFMLITVATISSIISTIEMAMITARTKSIWRR